MGNPELINEFSLNSDKISIATTLKHKKRQDTRLDDEEYNIYSQKSKKAKNKKANENLGFMSLAAAFSLRETVAALSLHLTSSSSLCACGGRHAEMWKYSLQLAKVLTRHPKKNR